MEGVPWRCEWKKGKEEKELKKVKNLSLYLFFFCDLADLNFFTQRVISYTNHSSRIHQWGSF
jgi:hypothetical protein